jgi:hypothetical protein
VSKLFQLLNHLVVIYDPYPNRIPRGRIRARPVFCWFGPAVRDGSESPLRVEHARFSSGRMVDFTVKITHFCEWEFSSPDALCRTAAGWGCVECWRLISSLSKTVSDDLSSFSFPGFLAEFCRALPEFVMQ